MGEVSDWGTGNKNTVPLDRIRFLAWGQQNILVLPFSFQTSGVLKNVIIWEESILDQFLPLCLDFLKLLCQGINKGRFQRKYQNIVLTVSGIYIIAPKISEKVVMIKCLQFIHALIASLMILSFKYD